MTPENELLVVILLWILAPFLFVVLLAVPVSLLPVLLRGGRAMRPRIEMVGQASLPRKGGSSPEESVASSEVEVEAAGPLAAGR